MLTVESTLLNQILASSDEDSFVPLKPISRKRLKQTPNERKFIFDPDNRLRKEHQNTVIRKVRHNVAIKKPYTDDDILRKERTEGVKEN
ncbi:hypothetical protein [Citrobacter sp. NCU1]|uniref:hypothetical protein n=1 Tax=Citrobacter sp. NCU1 TaxID=2026683 RepID=UPI001EE2C360|nr:hypothetical protein [Citrobacter sp. NCU1]